MINRAPTIRVVPSEHRPTKKDRHRKSILHIRPYRGFIRSKLFKQQYLGHLFHLYIRHLSSNIHITIFPMRTTRRHPRNIPYHTTNNGIRPFLVEGPGNNRYQLPRNHPSPLNIGRRTIRVGGGTISRNDVSFREGTKPYPTGYSIPLLCREFNDLRAAILVV